MTYERFDRLINTFRGTSVDKRAFRISRYVVRDCPFGGDAFASEDIRVILKSTCVLCVGPLHNEPNEAH